MTVACITAAFFCSAIAGAAALTYAGTTVQVSAPSTVCDAFSYGAVGDGIADDTAAVQAAITACAGGGTALLPGNGTFLTFGLATPSSAANFALRVDGVLRFNNATAAPQWKGVAACLSLQGAGVALVGRGLVDGQGAAWWPCAKAGCARPGLVTANKVTDLLIADLTFINSPNHNLELYASPFEVVNVTILAPPSTGVDPSKQSHNTDGIDVHGSPSYIHLTRISTGDDHIAIHANDTLIEDCVFGTGHGTSIGSLGMGTYLKNITVRDSSFAAATTVAHVKADTQSSGFLRDVVWRNISCEDVGETISIETNYPARGGSGVGTLAMSNISFVNISSRNAAAAGAFFCSKNAPCEGLRLINVTHTQGPKTAWACLLAHGTAQGVTPALTCLLP